MRKKKDSEKVKTIILQVRANPEEAEQYRAQAAARKMATSAYLRYLLLGDADQLAKEGSIRKAEDGGWEYQAMGEWRRPEPA